MKERENSGQVKSESPTTPPTTLPTTTAAAAAGCRRKKKLAHFNSPRSSFLFSHTKTHSPTRSRTSSPRSRTRRVRDCRLSSGGNRGEKWKLASTRPRTFSPSIEKKRRRGRRSPTSSSLDRARCGVGIIAPRQRRLQPLDSQFDRPSVCSMLFSIYWRARLIGCGPELAGSGSP